MKPKHLYPEVAGVRCTPERKIEAPGWKDPAGMKSGRQGKWDSDACPSMMSGAEAGSSPPPRSIAQARNAVKAIPCPI